MSSFFSEFSGDFIEAAMEKTKKITSNMVYCDYIAHLITSTLEKSDENQMAMIVKVGKMKYDLSEEGYFVSSKKTIEVTDINETKYLITVEQV